MTVAESGALIDVSVMRHQGGEGRNFGLMPFGLRVEAVHGVSFGAGRTAGAVEVASGPREDSDVRHGRAGTALAGRRV